MTCCRVFRQFMKIIFSHYQDPSSLTGTVSQSSLDLIDVLARRVNAYYISPFLHISQGLIISIIQEYLFFIQGVPKKTHFCVWQAIKGTRSGLETKVGWVLQNSGNFLSDEHKKSSFLSENDWEKWVQRFLPPLRKGMLLDHTKDLLLLLPFQWKIRLG